MDRLLAYVFGIPLPPGSTLFDSISIDAEFYQPQSVKTFKREKRGVRNREQIASSIITGLQRITKRKTLGEIGGLLDDKTKTSAALASALSLPLIEEEDVSTRVHVEAEMLTNPTHGRIRLLDLRRLHDALMAMHPEVLQVVADPKSPRSWDNYFLLKQRKPDTSQTMGQNLQEENTALPNENDSKVAVPEFCTPKALNEVRALNIESEIKWAELLEQIPRIYRRNLWIALSAERTSTEASSLVCPLSDHRFQRLVVGIKAVEKIGFRDGVTLNGVFNEWPDNGGRYVETIQTLTRETLASDFRDSIRQTLRTLENGRFASEGYINVERIREIVEEPHLVARYGNTLMRLRKVEEWIENLYTKISSTEAYNWSNLLQEVGYWPTFGPKSS